MYKGLKSDRIENTETAILIAVVLLYFAWSFQDVEFVIIAIVVLILSLIIPVLFFPFAKLWFGLAFLLGLVTTKLLLSIIFFLVVIPIGFLRKQIKPDTLYLNQFKKDTSSLMMTRDHKFVPEDLKNQF